MTGLALASTPTGELNVIRVFPDTPGSEADIQEGDTILAVGGVPVGKLGDEGVRDLLKNPGTDVRLKISRNGRTMSVTIRPRRLV
jgi:C-terminal processing protease CtpA/Prc